MKKIISILIVACIVIFLIMLLPGIGAGPGTGERSSSKNMEQVEELEQEEPETKNTNQEEATEKSVLKISVVENDYFYDNERISLEQLLQILKEAEGDYVIEIKDENASKKAYEALIDALDENGISYTEK